MAGIYRLIILSCFMASYLTTTAQELTLTQAIQLAKERNLLLQSQQKSNAVSEHNYKAEKANYLPTISLAAGFTHLSEELQLDLSSVQSSFVDGLSRQQVSTLDLVNQDVNGVPLTDAQKQNIYDASSSTLNSLYPDFNARLADQDYFMASVLLTQPIFLGGKLNGLNKIAASEYAIANQLYQQTSDRVVAEAIIQYFTVILFKEVVNTKQATLKAMEKHAFNTSKLVEQEIIPAYHELGAKAALSGAETRLAIAENDLEMALTAYKNLLNLPADTVLDLSSELHYLDMQLDEQETLEKSLAYSPLLQINNENQKIAKRNTAIAKSGYLPNIFAVGELQLYQNNLPVITPPWMIGVQLKWDIFSGNRNVNRTRAARLLEEETALTNQRITNDIRLAIQTSYNKAKNAQNIYQNETKTLKLTEASFNAIQKQYSHGMVTSNEVVDAGVLLDDARLAQLTALYTYYIALVELYKLKGDLNGFIELYEGKN